MKWLIWSNEHRGWWAPDSHGYVSARTDAGRYDFDEALEIVTGANKHLQRHVPNETMCPDWPAQ